MKKAKKENINNEQKHMSIKKYLTLFFVFLKLGLFTFGGGYAMISLLENECVEKRKWLKSDEFFKIVTIAETTPGPIAINSATYIGYIQGGILGSFLATLGVVIPSFTIIFIISLFFDNLLSIQVIANAFKGIKVGVSILILFGGIKMFKQLNKNVFCYILCALALSANLMISILSVKFSTIYLILIGGAIGFIAYLIANKDNLSNKTKDIVGDNVEKDILAVTKKLENSIENAKKTQNLSNNIDENVNYNGGNK